MLSEICAWIVGAFFTIRMQPRKHEATKKTLSFVLLRVFVLSWLLFEASVARGFSPAFACLKAAPLPACENSLNPELLGIPLQTELARRRHVADERRRGDDGRAREIPFAAQ